MKEKEGFKIENLTVLAHCGDRLNDLQEYILNCAWEGQTYSQMAKNRHLSEQYLKNQGSKLYEKLSAALGEKVNKNNFKEIVQRYSQKPCRDLKEAPDVSVFYGRTSELATLESWILGDKCRIITLLGMPGIGKSALAAKIVAEVEHEFEYVIWRNLDHSPSLTELLVELIEFFSGGVVSSTFKSSISQVMDFFYSHRCLVVLDGVEKLLESDRQYLSNCENYGCFFKRMAESNHQSCLLITTREKTPEIRLLESIIPVIRCLKLSGLDSESAQEIIKELPGELEWESIIKFYSGNPLFLKLALNKFQKNFSDFNLIFPTTNNLFFEQIGLFLNDFFSRLADWEIQVMVKLAQSEQPLSFEQIFSILKLPNHVNPLDFLESWEERSLLEKQRLGLETFFTVQPIILHYFRYIFFNSI